MLVEGHNSCGCKDNLDKNKKLNEAIGRIDFKNRKLKKLRNQYLKTIFREV
jgi:hypothetical protein